MLEDEQLLNVIAAITITAIEIDFIRFIFNVY
jgi:hypothetical protein